MWGQALIRFVCFIAGAGVLGALSHKTITATTGYESPDSLVTIAGAVVVGVIAILIGTYLWQLSKTIAIIALLVLVGGDLYQLGRTIDQVMQARSAQQASNIAISAARKEAQQRLDIAIREKRVAGQDERRALEVTQAEYIRLNDKATTASLDRSCGRSCRTLHAQSTKRASDAVDVARTALSAVITSADKEIAEARTALEKLPKPPETSAAAAFLGITPAAFNAILAGLKATSINIGAMVLLAIAGHGISLPKSVGTPDTRRESDKDHVGNFALDMYVPMSDINKNLYDTGIDLYDIRADYKRWCRLNGYAPLHESAFDETLIALAKSANLQVKGSVIYGMSPVSSQTKSVRGNVIATTPRIEHETKHEIV